GGAVRGRPVLAASRRRSDRTDGAGGALRGILRRGHHAHRPAARGGRRPPLAPLLRADGRGLAAHARRPAAVSRGRPEDRLMNRPDQATFIRALGLWDVVAMNIVAVVGLRWIARSARVGAPSVTLWLAACLLFFIPLALALIELSSRYPEQGGIYAWARRAFGPLHGFVVGWCMWVNNLSYFPS